VSVDLEIHETGIATLTINRPEKANALDTPHMNQFVEALETIRSNRDVKVAVMTGAGTKAFCAGMDWQVLEEPDMPGYRFHDVPDGLMLNMPAYFKGIDIWKPIIAAINGPAIATGAHMVIGSDIRIASTNASIAFNETQFGDIADGGGLSRLPRQIPFVYAMDLLITGRQVGAEEMLRMGLVNEVVAPDKLMPRAMEIARYIVEKTDASAVQITKRAVIRGLDVGLSHALFEEALFKEMLTQKTSKGNEEKLYEWGARFRTRAETGTDGDAE
jgi:enoyl-CoA hydratase/carnithine racemase